MGLEAEAEFLAGRSCGERADYLREVAACRGQDVADALRRLVMELLWAREKNAREARKH